MAKRRKTVTGPQDQDDLVFKALAGRERRQILDLLRDGPMTTGDIGKRLDHLDRTTVMLHLRVLEQARLIFSKKEGRSRWNYLDVAPIQQIYERWIEEYAKPSAKLLNNLKESLEREE